MTGTVRASWGLRRYAGGQRRAMSPNSSTILEPYTGAHPGRMDGGEIV
jgi:hypothetical protein